MSMPASSCSLIANKVASSLPTASSSLSSRQGAQSLFGTASQDGFGRLPAMLVGKSCVTWLVVMAGPGERFVLTANGRRRLSETRLAISNRFLTMTDAASVPALEFIFSAHVTVDPALDLGDVGKGGRRIVPITGGDFSGPQMRGQVLPGGADWQVLRSDGTAELEARYTLRTDEGVL